MMKSKYKIIGVCVVAGISLLVVGGFGIHFLMAGGRGDLTVETNYMFQLADKNKDGGVSENEWRIFKQSQNTVAESQGKLKLSETGDVVENILHIRDESMRNEFLERCMKKNAAESFRHK